MYVHVLQSAVGGSTIEAWMSNESRTECAQRMVPHAGMGGFSWAVSGFLLGTTEATTITEEDKQRVAREIKTTFSTTYQRRLTLAQMLDPAAMKAFQAQKTGSKSLVVPQQLSAGL